MTHLPPTLGEYLETNGLHPITYHNLNHAWGYRENEPVFAFILDPGDGSLGFQDAMNLYWATAGFISKPWCLIMVIQAPMKPRNKQILNNLASRYNIQILEDPSPQRVMRVVKQELTTLTSLMSRYIQPGTENPSVSLAESIKSWKGEPVVHLETHNVSVETLNLELYETQGELLPSRGTIPLTAQSGEEEIEGILFRLIQNHPPVFHTEHRNLPVVLSINLGKQVFTTRFEADKGSLIEAAGYESLMRAFKCLDEISFINPNTGLPVFQMRKKLDK